MRLNIRATFRRIHAINDSNGAGKRTWLNVPFYRCLVGCAAVTYVKQRYGRRACDLIYIYGLDSGQALSDKGLKASLPGIV